MRKIVNYLVVLDILILIVFVWFTYEQHKENTSYGAYTIASISGKY